MRNDIIKYISECAYSIRSKAGKDIESKPFQIIAKDGWELSKDIAKNQALPGLSTI